MSSNWNSWADWKSAEEIRDAVAEDPNIPMMQIALDLWKRVDNLTAKLEALTRKLEGDVEGD